MDDQGVHAGASDLVKREVYQLGDFLNREFYHFDAIPPRVFDRVPTAELARGQVDPFFYGGVHHRGPPAAGAQ